MILTNLLLTFLKFTEQLSIATSDLCTQSPQHINTVSNLRKSPYSSEYRKIQNRKNSVFGHFSGSENEIETLDKRPDKRPGIFICILLELYLCNKKKKLI